MPVTIRQIAADANVSVPTVSQILNGRGDRFRAETRDRVLASAKKLQFKPNRAARLLRGSRTRTIGLIAHGISGYSGLNQADMVATFDQTLRDHGYRSLMGFCWADSGQMVEHINEMLAHQVEGIVLISPQAYTQDVSLDELIPAELPTLVTFGKATDQIGRTCDDVRVDYAAGMQTLVEHCLKQGHRSFAFVCSKLATNLEKYEGIASTLAEHGIAFDRSCVLEGADGLEHESHLTGDILKRTPRPTCVICSNDYVAIGVIRGLKNAGLDVPGDISVTGHDDLWIARICDVPLTTLRIPREQLGIAAAEMMLEQIQSEEQTGKTRTFDLELQVRGSVGPAKG